VSLAKGDIVLVPFPFTDLSQTKLRPAVVLWVDRVGNDVIVCLISSQNLTNLNSDEFYLDSKDPEFFATGLKIASKVKVSRIVTIERRFITRRIGKLGTNQTLQLNKILIKTFQL
jgi:mRNA interferase MazF